MTIIVTGGAGFIGSNFVLDWLKTSDEPVVNLDKLTYAGNLQNLSSIQADPRHSFVQGDICDRALVDSLFATHQPRAIIHFAAESHVDRSIHGPGDFNQDWVRNVQSGAYRKWVDKNYASRQVA
jgi:dTDP-glucose 4,6-dehydratase